MTVADYYAKDCLGRNVNNPQGEKLGTIDDMAITRNGEVMFLIIGFNGFLGMGEDKVAMPYDMFEWNEQEGDLVINITEDQLKNAPRISKNHMPEVGDVAYYDEVNTYYANYRNAA